MAKNGNSHSWMLRIHCELPIHENSKAYFYWDLVGYFDQELNK